MAKPKGLGSMGRGLSDLLGVDEGTTFTAEKKETINIANIEPNKNQPRKEFSEDALNELCESIKEHGLIQPIIVREISDGRYQIIAGERRYRACKKAKITEIPVRILEATDSQVAQFALIENLQREDLNPLEESKGYFELMKNYSMTQEQVSKSVSKSRSAIANALRILQLDEAVLEYVQAKLISAGHARAILAVEDKALHKDFAELIIASEMNVRKAEQHAKKLNKGIKPKEEIVPNIYMEDMELKMEESLCRKVKIVSNKSKKGGKLLLDYMNDEDLEKLTTALFNINI